MKFLKSQWFSLCLALIAIALAITALVLENDLMAVAWTVSFVYWIISARTMYDDERITALEKEVEQLKNRAITDIEETEPNNYVCMRRLGPDKETPNV